MTDEMLRLLISQDREKLLALRGLRQRDLIGSLIMGALGYPAAQRSHSPTLDHYAIEFELGYPRLSAGLREVADSVAKMGV